MKNKVFNFQLWNMVLTTILITTFSPLSTADLLDDIGKVGDLIKQVGKKATNSHPTPKPSLSPQPTSKSNEAITPRDLSLKLSRPEHYYERPQHFNSLEFELGEYKTIEPLDKATFNNLYVPSYKGVPLLALTPGYLQVKVDVNTKNAVVNRFKNDMLIYHNLRLLDVMEKHITTENLKVDTSNKATFKAKNPKHLYRAQEKTLASDKNYYKYVPRFHIESLVTTLLPDIHQRYFHDPAGSYSSSIFQRAIHAWGGYDKNNEFKSRRAYFNFIDTEVPKLKAWAKSLTHENYIAGTVALGEYDFKRQGFEFSLFPPRGPYQQFFYAPRDKESIVFTRGNEQGQLFFLAIDEAKAETLLSQTKTTPNRSISQLYFAVKGEVYSASSNGADRRRHSQTYVGMHLAYDVTGDTIEFFSDELLTQKVFESNVN